MHVFKSLYLLSFMFSCIHFYRLDTLQQTKARLELSNQTLKQSHGTELEGREQELEQVKNTMSKKLKALNQQLEEMDEERRAAVKVKTTVVL